MPQGNLRCAGITGTKGKTTTTTWLAAALSAAGAPALRATTLGYHLGERRLDCPSTFDGFLQAMRAASRRGASHAAVETTSEALASGLMRVWSCDVGVFTNLSHDHLDAHRTFEHYLASKAQLFLHLPDGGTAVLNGCDGASELLEEVLPRGVRVVRYGALSRGPANKPLDLSASSVRVDWTGTRVEIQGRDHLGLPREIILRAHGEVYAENALAALAAAVSMGVPGDIAARAISETSAPSGRFEIVAERPWAIVDYAHTPDSLARTVATARRLCTGRLTVVTGAGGNRDRSKRPAMGAAASAADRVILTSDNPRDESPAAIAEELRSGLDCHPCTIVELDRARAIHLALRDADPDDVVLVAGKGHESEQIVGSGAVRFSDREEILTAARGGIVRAR